MYEIHVNCEHSRRVHVALILNLLRREKSRFPERTRESLKISAWTIRTMIAVIDRSVVSRRYAMTSSPTTISGWIGENEDTSPRSCTPTKANLNLQIYRSGLIGKT
jgi:hypothetical protein